eukprot:CAMPEP_0182924678 /NCGR_PEP_ID=MMETSP0105_2-20130417/6935_1 /TAXON_ID=81532 ORGANISM="Acanthoeca-like sp., Strain 10tr" /NCGR_SAMPLE_ID=MMETSP0105_2 /ASSEMBLY_ACC=CAM_ASM_000205 /LENGTH=152 /DNA_ID=CAMNT_0025062477 /DNA_START=27 /DNA_END=483 /DNA_ORIENTATION=-
MNLTCLIGSWTRYNDTVGLRGTGLRPGCSSGTTPGGSSCRVIVIGAQDDLFRRTIFQRCALSVVGHPGLEGGELVVESSPQAVAVGRVGLSWGHNQITTAHSFPMDLDIDLFPPGIRHSNGGHGHSAPRKQEHGQRRPCTSRRHLDLVPANQ